MAEDGWTGVDRWITSNDNSVISEQTVRLTDKGKCSAFGEAVVGSGRAEWDLTIEFESFGGISIGIFRQDLRDRDNINALPTEETFTYTPDGYGYANKTGAFTANKERKKYGQRYRHGDKITVRLDLQARTLHFLVNDEDQGLAYDGLPKGAYRLACCMQFQEQKVVVTRFWTSLGKNATIPKLESTKTQTAKEDKKGKEHVQPDSELYEPPVEVAKSKKQSNYDPEYKAPEIDPDAPTFGDDYGQEEEEDDVYVPEESDDEDAGDVYGNGNEEAPMELQTKSVKESLDDEEREALNELEKQKPKHGKQHSLEDINNEINEQYGQKLNEELDKLQNMTEEDYENEEEEEKSVSATKEIDAVGLIGGRSRGMSTAEKSKVPEPLSIESVDEDATDYFSLSGTNLKASGTSVTCIRQTNGTAHTAFATQLVSRGRIEWMLKIDTGHSIRIGVCGQTESVDRDFTQTKYGYGYGDDGNIYFGGSHIEYNDGFKAGDIIGVYLNMDMNTLKFSVNGADHGAAFDSIKLNENDNVNGYRLAVSLQHRPHKLTLLEATLYNVERRSPRPSSNQFGSNGHQRKLSYTTMQKNKQKQSGKSSPTTNKSSEEEENVEKAAGEKSKAGKAGKSKSKAAGKESKGAKKGKGDDSKSKKKGKATSAAAKKKGATESASKKKGVASKSKKKGAAEKKTGTKASKTKTPTTASKKKEKNLSPSLAKKKGKSASMTPSKKKGKKDADDEKKEDSKSMKKSKSRNKLEVNWSKRDDVSKDKWDQSGPKLQIEKSAVSTKANIKDGNSCFGKLVVKNKMKAKWEVTVKQGDNVGIGVCNISGGLSAKNKKLLTQSFTSDINGYGYMSGDGGCQRSGRHKKYGKPFKAGDKVGVILDTQEKSLSFELNGEDLGVAFKNLPSGEYRVAVSMFEKLQKVILNKVTVWDVAK